MLWQQKERKMDNAERDNMLIEMHGDIKVIREKVVNHGSTLYGPDGNSGITKKVTVLEERQNNYAETKRLNIATVAMICMILTLIIDIIFRFKGKF